ncbi:hypothetical protein ACLB2K_016435 [Fragaria x ananassa]
MSSSSGIMPPRRRPRVATSSNANEGDDVRGLVDSIGDMLRGALDRVQHPRSMRKKDVSDAGAVEFNGAKGPLDAYSWVDKMERTFESTELPEEKKVKMTISFLDDSAHYCRFALHANVPSSSLPGEWHVSLPSSEVMRIDWVFSECEVLVEGFNFKADLIPLNMVEFDVILGMDFLETYKDMVDCFRKEVVLRSLDGFEVVFQGERDVISSCLISAMAVRKLLNKDCLELEFVIVMNVVEEVERKMLPNFGEHRRSPAGASAGADKMFLMEKNVRSLME